MSFLNSVSVAFCRSLAKDPGRRAPDVAHAPANAAAAFDACDNTPASWVVLVTASRMLFTSFCCMKLVNTVTLDANLVSATILPICALGQEVDSSPASKIVRVSPVRDKAKNHGIETEDRVRVDGRVVKVEVVRRGRVEHWNQCFDIELQKVAVAGEIVLVKLPGWEGCTRGCFVRWNVWDNIRILEFAVVIPAGQARCDFVLSEKRKKTAFAVFVQCWVARKVHTFR